MLKSVGIVALLPNSNELPRNKFNVLKHSHHVLVETTQAINLLNPEGPLLSENFYIHRAKSYCFVVLIFLVRDAAFLAPLASHSKGHQVFYCDRVE